MKLIYISKGEKNMILITLLTVIAIVCLVLFVTFGGGFIFIAIDAIVAVIIIKEIIDSAIERKQAKSERR